MKKILSKYQILEQKQKNLLSNQVLNIQNSQFGSYIIKKIIMWVQFILDYCSKINTESKMYKQMNNLNMIIC